MDSAGLAIALGLFSAVTLAFANLAVKMGSDILVGRAILSSSAAVMILPAGVNKASGLIAALKEMDISPHNVVGIGDAENDHAFLRLCEMSVAVANALPAVKDTADFITTGDHSQGVCQLIEGLIANDLADVKKRVIGIESELFEISDDLHEVRPEYLEKLEKIQKEKGRTFESKEEFLKFLKNEV